MIFLRMLKNQGNSGSRIKGRRENYMHVKEEFKGGWIGQLINVESERGRSRRLDN